MDKLLIATTNRGKQREYEQLLGDLGIELTWPDAIGVVLDVPETGSTYLENARLKAEAYAAASGLWTLADDSGLEVDALGGEPGVHSARYGEPGYSDEQRHQLLLSRMENVRQWGRRTARFRCVIALVSPAGDCYWTEGVLEGMISYSPRGSQGFGYDPIFYLPDLDQTVAELPPETKNRLSHRARAAAAMRRLLREEILPHG